jgi:hypothetical protein
MFVMTRRVPFAGLWGWPGGLGHPILRLLGFLLAVVGTVVLVAVSVVFLILDIVLIPVRLLL